MKEMSETLHFGISSFVIIMSIHVAVTIRTEPVDGFYNYVLNKGINIHRIAEGVYHVSYSRWSCEIDTSMAKNFKKRHSSWTDIFETRIEVLRKQNPIFSAEELRKKIGILPDDGSPVILVARQGNVSIPKENVIIRLNNHGPLNARTTMIMTWSDHVRSLLDSVRKQPNKEIIKWTHINGRGKNVNCGLWNISQPLVIPEDVWGLNGLICYRGPLYFMKGNYRFGNFAKCRPRDGIGLGAINRIAHLKGNISTLGFSLGLDKYNTHSCNRFELLAHKLVWSFFVVRELTDGSVFVKHFDHQVFTSRHWIFSDGFQKFEITDIEQYVFIVIVMLILISIISCSKRNNRETETVGSLRICLYAFFFCFFFLLFMVVLR